MDDPPQSYVREYRIKSCIDCGIEFQTTGHNSKRCTSCKPAYQVGQNKKYRDRNRDRLAVRAKAIRAADPEKARADERRRRDARGKEREAEYQRRYKEKHRVRLALKRRCSAFGITLDGLLAMFERQGTCCAICVLPLELGGRWDMDHCHKTGQVRGILCMQCNRGIGMLRDDAAICRRAAKYLQSFDKSSLASGA